MSATASRTVYLPRMADHALGVAAAMRHFGIEARVMDPPDAESLAIGLDLCRGRECLPCFLCTGDMVRQTRRPDFRPERSIFFMPTGPGPCRFGQYRLIERDVLDDLGLEQVDVVSPDSSASYTMFGADPTALRKLIWHAAVAVDLLLKLVHEHRPYEREPGAADHAYARGLDLVVEAVEAEGCAGVARALRLAGAEFERVAVDRTEPRPLIGIVGELFVMLNAFSNGRLVREVEAAGGEVLQSTFMDWLHFTAWVRKSQDWLFGDYRDWAAAALVGLYQDRVEHGLRHAVARHLRHPEEEKMGPTMHALERLYDPALGTEAVVTMGRALDQARNGACGILNVLPFSCMPGIVVAAMAPHLKQPFGDLPWLDLSYDGQESTNIRTRLEAFMHQASRYQKRGLARQAQARPA